MSWNKRNNNNR